MKINLKIILPIFILLSIILIAFGYLLYYIEYQTKETSFESAKFQRINNLGEKLGSEQETMEYNIITYTFNQDPNALIAIAQSEINKAHIIDQIYPYIDNENDKSLIDKYLKSRENIGEVQSQFLKAIATKDARLINEKFKIWNAQTQQIRKNIVDVNENNSTSLATIFDSLKDLEAKIAQIILFLFTVVIIAIFIFFYYLKYFITSPIEKLSGYAEEVANNNFSNIMDDNLMRKDEIGILYKAFNNMSRQVKKSYTSFEQNIKDRTQELLKRTEELEYSQKATLNILEDLNIEKQNLLETKALDEAILTSIGDGLVVINKHGEITYTNDSFEEITGWSRDEAINKVFVDLIPSENESGLKTPNQDRFISRILGGFDPIENTVDTAFYVKKDGSRFPVNSLVKRIILQKELIGAVKTFRDVTREKDIDRAKTEFVSLAAHQLRTPLSAISWYTEMLLSGDAGDLLEIQKKYLEQIYQGNQRMIDMVKSFLNVSRIDMGHMTIEKKSTDISLLLKSVLEEQKQNIISKNLDLSLECDKEMPPIEIDPLRIRMVLQNLLSNAIKYTPINGRIAISLNSNIENKEIMLIVQDTGYGIPQADFTKIFSKMFRSSNVIERATDGTGLGLYIVKNIVEGSGGKIWFESVENQGSTFYVTFPT